MKYIQDINMKGNPNTQKQQAYSFWHTIIILYSYNLGEHLNKNELNLQKDIKLQ